MITNISVSILRHAMLPRESMVALVPQLVQDIAALPERDAHEALGRLQQAADVAGNKDYVAIAISALLKHDRIDLATATIPPGKINIACEIQALELAQTSPKTFAHWAQPTLAVARRLGQLAGQHFDDEQTLAFVSGDASVHPLATKLHALLSEDPSLWAAMPLSLIGDNHSPLRQAAMDLGWRPQHLEGMLRQVTDLYKKVDHLLDAIDYPYSTVCALRLLNEKEGRVDSSQILKEKVELMGADVPTLPMHANPIDVAFGQMICTRHASEVYRWEKHPETPDISQDEWLHLEGFLEMHAALDAWPVLLDAVLQGRLGIRTHALNVDHEGLVFPEMEFGSSH